MVIARMSEDRSKTVKISLNKSCKNLKAIYTCMCTPVGACGVDMFAALSNRRPSPGSCITRPWVRSAGPAAIIIIMTAYL
eukprot:8225667-Heterocapsa_arctica.AAC.1